MVRGEGHAPFDLTCNEAIRNAADTRAAISLNGRSKEAHFSHLREDFFVEFWCLKVSHIDAIYGVIGSRSVRWAWRIRGKRFSYAYIQQNSPRV